MQKFSTGKFHRDFPVARLFDDLVGASKQFRRHVEPDRSRSLEVDHKLELGCLLDRQISALGASQDAAGIDADLMASVILVP
jgi:hypothetical protein